MAATAQIKAVITADDRASQTISKFGSTSAAAFGAIAGIASSVTAKAIDSVTQSIGDAVKRVDILNNSNRVFANMGFQANDVKASMDTLKNSILGLPTPLDKAVSGMQMIASSTGDIKLAQGIFSALNDAVIGFGGTAEDVSGATLQLSQAFSNGRIDAQTWNSMMQNNLGPTLNSMAKQMGITTGQLKEGLSDGTISVKTFQDQLINLDKNGGGGLQSLQKIAHDATSGIGTGMENAKTAMVRGIADIVQAIGASNISGAITALGNAAETLFKSIAKLVTFLEQHPIITATVLGALGSIILTTLVPAFIAWAVSATSAAIATVAATWPILAIGAAIGAVAYLVVTHWDTIRNAFNAAVGWIAERMNYMKDHFWEIIGFILGFFATLPIKIPLLVAEAIFAAVRFLMSVNWSAVLSSIGRAFEGVWNWVKNAAIDAFNYMKNINWGQLLTNVGKGVGNAIIGLLEGAINGALSGIPGNPKVKLPRFAKGVRNFSGGMAVVGEQGAEIVQLPGGSNVIPNDKLSGLGGSTNINISINSVYSAGTELEKRKFANDILNALRDVANSKNMTLGDLIT